MHRTKKMKVRAVAALRGYRGKQLPRGRDFCTRHGFSEKALKRIIAPAFYTELKKAAGFPVKEQLTEEDYYAHYADLVREHKGVPPSSSWTLCSLSWLAQKVGNWRSMPQKFQVYCLQNNVYREVLQYLPCDTRPGYVYLYKTDRGYKIGHALRPRKRVSSFNSVTTSGGLVHEIRTDDMQGIEAYWHHRFRHRWVKGEVFKLNPMEVATFTSRHTM